MNYVGMSFHSLDERTEDSSPKIRVTFPDGYIDNLVLWKHYFNDEDRKNSDDHCNYVGHLENEKDACVAMTGCLGSDHIGKSKIWFKLSPLDGKFFISAALLFIWLPTSDIPYKECWLAGLELQKTKLM